MYSTQLLQYREGERQRERERQRKRQRQRQREQQRMLLFIRVDIRDKRLPILCLANKMDLAGALSPVEVAKGMGLDRIDKPHCIL